MVYRFVSVQRAAIFQLVFFMTNLACVRFDKNVRTPLTMLPLLWTKPILSETNHVAKNVPQKSYTVLAAAKMENFDFKMKGIEAVLRTKAAVVSGGNKSIN